MPHCAFTDRVMRAILASSVLGVWASATEATAASALILSSSDLLLLLEGIFPEIVYAIVAVLHAILDLVRRRLGDHLGRIYHVGRQPGIGHRAMHRARRKREQHHHQNHGEQEPANGTTT